MSDVTQILSQMDAGDPRAAELIVPVVYDELRKLAIAKLAQEKPGRTLQATALVHEAYLRLVDGKAACQWKSRGHFFAAAAEAMRRILIEHARAKHTKKRGGGRQRVELDVAAPVALQCDNLDELLELDEALARLEQEDVSKAQLVKLLYFAGFTLDEAAAAQGLTRSTAYRHWLYARAWLRNAIAGRAKSSS
jgi:RNA polymerase sigma factor (TIGR02999 family)